MEESPKSEQIKEQIVSFLGALHDSSPRPFFAFALDLQYQNQLFQDLSGFFLPVVPGILQKLSQDRLCTNEEVDIDGTLRTYEVHTSRICYKGVSFLQFEFFEMTEQEVQAAQYDNLIALLQAITHEIRSPLTAIATYAELFALAFEKLEELGIEQIEDVPVSTIPPSIRSKISQIIDTLEALTPLASVFSDEIRHEVIGLEAIITSAQQSDKVVAAFKSALEIRDTKPKIETQATSHKVIGDKELLKIVFTNLLSNAIKYGGEQIRIEVTDTVPSGSFITVTVNDNGDVIPEEDLDKLFKPYDKPKTSKRMPSIGLGLPLVRFIIEAHGGSIKVSSTEAEGTTFSFTLPIAIAAETAKS